MKLVFTTDHMRYSGGRRLMFDYAEYLIEKGHDVKILVEREEGELAGTVPVTVIPSLNDAKIYPECDLIIGTSPKEVRQAYKSKKAPVVHFCQGFELTDLEQRLSGKALPPRFEGSGFKHKLKMLRKKRTWSRKYKQFDKIYHLPTHLITISKHLKDILEARYGRTAHLCCNGIDQNKFYPDSDWKAEPFTEERPMKIINIGPYHITYKGVETTVAAVRKAKEIGIPIKFTRISPLRSDLEEERGIDYDLHIKIPQDDFCKYLRESDVYISNSTEREGFGLPAMESLRSGLVSILSEISCYKDFSDRRDHCIFVPQGDVEATLAGIKRIYEMRLDERTQFRKNALEVSEYYSMERACREFEEILEKINSSEE